MKKHLRELDEIGPRSHKPVAPTRPHVDATTDSIPRPGRTRSAGDVLRMQQVLGNRHVTRALGRERPDAAGKPSSSNRGGLPDALRGSIERLSGESLADVEVHYDSPKPARLHALAYTKGTEIHMGPGQAHHLPHEAWHVVQQKQGRVTSTTRAGKHHVNDDIGLEHEADTMGRRASSLQRRSPAIAGPAGRTVGPARAPRRPVIQLLSQTRKPFNGMQIKLHHTRWAREWKLALYADNGEGAEVCSILLKLETRMKGGLPRLSIDTMQSRSKSGGAGTELLSSIPWAVAKIVEKNPIATRLGQVALHSGFGNIIAYQMAVKKYAAALELRDTDDWHHRYEEASAALPERVELDADEEAPLAPSRRAARQAYDMSRFPELWADTHALINSGFFQIDGPMIDLWSVTETVAAITQKSKLLLDSFHAKVDVKDLSELNAQVEELKEQARQAMEMSVTNDEAIEY